MKKMALNKTNLVIIIFLELAGIFLWKNYGYHWLKIVRYVILTADDGNPRRAAGRRYAGLSGL